MSMLNDNVVAFVGDAEQMRNILLTMAENYKESASQLQERGFDSPEPLPAFDASSTVDEIAKAIREHCYEPMYLFDPNESSYCTSDSYEFEPPKALMVPTEKKWWYCLTLAFCSSPGIAGEALERFTRKLPSGSYAIAGAYQFEGDSECAYMSLGNFQDGGAYECGSAADKKALYFDGGDDLWRRKEIEKEIADYEKEPLNAQKIAKGIVLQAASNMLGLGLTVKQPQLKPHKVKSSSPKRKRKKAAPIYEGSFASAIKTGDVSEIRYAVEYYLPSFLRQLPLVIGVTNSACESREAVVETLLVGQQVKLVANWESAYSHPCVIEAYTADGRRFGNLDENAGMTESDQSFSDNHLASSLYISLALALPHVTGVVEEVLPLSAQRKRSKHSEVTVRIEIAEGSLENLFDEANALLEKPVDERNVPNVTKEPGVLVRGARVDADQSKARRQHVRKAGVSKLIALYLAKGGREILLRCEAGGTRAEKAADLFLPQGIVGIDVGPEVEFRETTFLAVDGFALKTGETFSFHISRAESKCPPGTFVVEVKEGRRVLFTSRPFADDGRPFMRGKQLGEAWIVASEIGRYHPKPHVEVVSVELSGGHTIARIRYRFAVRLSRETMLYILRQMGIVKDEDLAGGDDWLAKLDSVRDDSTI